MLALFKYLDFAVLDAEGVLLNWLNLPKFVHSIKIRELYTELNRIIVFAGLLAHFGVKVH